MKKRSRRYIVESLVSHLNRLNEFERTKRTKDDIFASNKKEAEKNMECYLRSYFRIRSVCHLKVSLYKNKVA